MFTQIRPASNCPVCGAAQEVMLTHLPKITNKMFSEWFVLKVDVTQAWVYIAEHRSK